MWETQFKRLSCSIKMDYSKCSKSSPGSTIRSLKTSTFRFLLAKVILMIFSAEFRQAVLASLKIGSSTNAGGSYNKINNNSKLSHLGNSSEMGSRLRSRSRSPINDRTLESAFTKKGTQTNVNYPVLHYF